MAKTNLCGQAGTVRGGELSQDTQVINFDVIIFQRFGLCYELTLQEIVSVLVTDLNEDIRHFFDKVVCCNQFIGGVEVDENLH